MKIEDREIAKLDLRSGDILVLKVPLNMSVEDVQVSRRSLSLVVPEGVQIAVIYAGVDLTVVRGVQLG
jgi:hypothetical protein